MDRIEIQVICNQLNDQDLTDLLKLLQVTTASFLKARKIDDIKQVDAVGYPGEVVNAVN